MNKYLSIIIILILAIGCGFFGVAYFLASNDTQLTPEQHDALPYLIECMEEARGSHQQFLDMPPELKLLYTTTNKTAITIHEPARFYLNRIGLTLDDQEYWVEIYDQVIPILEANLD